MNTVKGSIEASKECLAGITINPLSLDKIKPLCSVHSGIKYAKVFEPCHEIMVLFALRKLILQTRMGSHPVGIDVWFLVHLSRRLTRWAYSIPMVRHPSVVVRRRPHFQTWISLKPVGQSWSKFMCSITVVWERLYKVLGQIGSKLWFPLQQKAPIDL